MNLADYSLADLTDSVGAVSFLSRRFERSYTVEAIRKMVERDHLRALYFEDGMLKERTPGIPVQGKNWFFLRGDLEVLERPKRGRRWHRDRPL